MSTVQPRWSGEKNSTGCGTRLAGASRCETRDAQHAPLLPRAARRPIAVEAPCNMPRPLRLLSDISSKPLRVCSPQLGHCPLELLLKMHHVRIVRLDVERLWSWRARESDWAGETGGRVVRSGASKRTLVLQVETKHECRLGCVLNRASTNLYQAVQRFRTSERNQQTPAHREAHLHVHPPVEIPERWPRHGAKELHETTEKDMKSFTHLPIAHNVGQKPG